MSIANLIDLQLKYYNEHNLQGFLSTYHDDITVFNLSDNSIIISGKEELRERYRERFEVLKVHADIKNRIIIGNKVIDHEYVTGLQKQKTVKAVAIYEVEENLIKQVWFILE